MLDTKLSQWEEVFPLAQLLSIMNTLKKEKKKFIYHAFFLGLGLYVTKM